MLLKSKRWVSVLSAVALLQGCGDTQPSSVDEQIEGQLKERPESVDGQIEKQLQAIHNQWMQLYEQGERKAKERNDSLGNALAENFQLFQKLESEDFSKSLQTFKTECSLEEKQLLMRVNRLVSAALQQQLQGRDDYDYCLDKRVIKDLDARREKIGSDYDTCTQLHVQWIHLGSWENPQVVAVLGDLTKPMTFYNRDGTVNHVSRPYRDHPACQKGRWGWELWSSE